MSGRYHLWLALFLGGLIVASFGVVRCNEWVEEGAEIRDAAAKEFCTAFTDHGNAVVESCEALVKYNSGVSPRSDDRLRACSLGGLPAVCKDSTDGHYYEWARGIHVYVLVSPEGPLRPYTLLILPNAAVEAYRPPITYEEK